MNAKEPDGTGKPALRKAMAVKRDALTPYEREARSRRLCDVVVAQALQPLGLKLGRPLTVVLYGAFRSEADPAGVLDWCVASGHRAVAPRVREDGSGMELRIVASSADWRPERYGVPSPDPLRTEPLAADVRPDVVLVPGMAFDRHGGRLGYGGGYYDRLAEALGPGSLPYWIGFAFALQLSGQVLPKEAHDLALHGVATEEGLIWFAEEGL
ncbi:5-formyltetrahydrofolate cyclo-ligase [Cohnella hashimotonis]|uniref:5-formyltetrahydrofolate cyclo-ligase n=1 Tax=Cohnella hashimotonis TaxID=2826895 RepID=A0ABT6TD06_9BACL|nr:5-formyltetrahydrofolate cyclo-ligase [Cohnella hashimotonis]MDI4644198.1 5-formyltetrahydrofolate cyclo-ligase [Cohnella hashimotonis]